ncbi:MAG: endonuclease/exonuclease/phosphatase family protein [Geminicoccaceae bacterium]|nr:endonuclease/exonuclease/phosphatase family protein [Geminicoccaceae bacterium]
MRLLRGFRPGHLLNAIGLALAGAMAIIPFASDLSSRADLLTQFLLQAAALTAISAAIMLLRHRWPSTTIYGLCLLVQIFHIQPALVPSSSAEAHVPTIRLLFSNLWADNTSRAAAISTIERMNPDILVLAEFLRDWRKDAAALIASYPAQADCFNLSGCDVVILSRFPVSATSTPADRWLRSRAVLADVDTPQGPLAVIGAHMTRPIPIGQVYHQERHAQLITDLAAGVDGPTVLVGDFNAVPWGRVVHEIERNSRLTAHRGIQGTWPSALPWPLRLPIDQVLTSNEVEIVSREVVNMPGSDHKAVLVELRIKTR